MSNLVRHSPTALKRYMSDMEISADELAQISSIAVSKISTALNQDQIFKLNQLESIAKALFVPTVYLTTDEYVFEREAPELIEFRNQKNISENRYKYRALIEEFARVRQDYLEVIESLEEEALPFNLELTGDDAIEDAQRIESYFNFHTTKKIQYSADDYFRAWRSIVESKDVLVINKGREKFGSDGMSLFFSAVPVIVIFSSGQSPSRQLFTLIHELVHIGLGQSVFDGYLTESNKKIERYCDLVAGYVIAPSSIINELYDPEKSLNDNVLVIRNKTKASKAAIAIQLKNINLITSFELNDYLDYIRPPESPSGGFGQSKDNMVLKYYGREFVSRVMNALWQNSISASTAKQILGISSSSTGVLRDLQDKVFS